MSQLEENVVANRGVSRRSVLITIAGTTLLGGCMARQSSVSRHLPSFLDEQQPEGEWPDVRVAYLRPREDYWLGWPGTAWKPREFRRDSRGMVEGFGREVKVRTDFESDPLYDEAAVAKFIASVQADKPRAVLLFPLHMNQWRNVGEIASKCGAPTIVFAPLGVCFTGHIQQISKQPGVYLASCADFDLDPVRFGLKMVRANHDIRRTRIAVLVRNESRDETLEPLGVQIRYLPRSRFPETLKTIEEADAVRQVAEEYRRAARRIVEPTHKDMINASKNYFAALKIMEEEACQGISMDCLGLVYGREIPCPPCLAWSKLLDAGIPGVCEADINAVMSNTLCCRLLDKPGFMQDPVPNTVDNTFIGAHCVCPTRLNGYHGPRETFDLRSHAESDLGVVFQVIWKPGQDVTIMQCVGPGKMILGEGKVLRNHTNPPAGGCRTSVELEIDGPPDTRDTKGFHQLFIYGRHQRDFEAYGQMYGIATEHI
ncbi:MAG: hypothetical protein JSV91_15585 [Phycisphaerales bacterium]|nr:MAG: hypothetical protein JSV91_15585 [Phycisphaerales bacterium]